MGFVLSILYFLICYLTPVGLFGPLVKPLRIELILAILIFAVSLPALIRSFVTKTPQALALAGLAVAVFLSMLIGKHWPGGATTELLKFIPGTYAFFLVCLHCNSKQKLNLLVLMLLFVCVFVIIQGNLDLIQSAGQMPEAAPGENIALNRFLWDQAHPYLLTQQISATDVIYRIRGLGIINDPNDFGQLLVCEIPLLFLLWRPKKQVRNLALVLVPAGVLCYGIFLTHSRGALLAILAVVLFASRRRLGTVLSAVLSGGLFAGAMAIQFTGGREISADAGTDRTDLWGQSLQLLKTHPIFGVGMEQLPDLIGQTAHNSIMVCAAELGLFGLFFWSLFLLSSARDVFIIAMPKTVNDAVKEKDEDDQPLFNVWRGAALNKADVNRIGRCLLLSLIGYLVGGWFLSRAFTITFFLLGGMIEIIYEAARSQGMVPSRLPLTRSLSYSALLMIALTVIVYLMVRVLNVMK
jgi:O-antigen ligase